MPSTLMGMQYNMDMVYSHAWNEVYLQIIRVFLNSIPKLHPPKFYGQNWNFRSGKENKDIIAVPFCFTCKQSTCKVSPENANIEPLYRCYRRSIVGFWWTKRSWMIDKYVEMFIKILVSWIHISLGPGWSQKTSKRTFPETKTQFGVFWSIFK